METQAVEGKFSLNIEPSAFEEEISIEANVTESMVKKECEHIEKEMGSRTAILPKGRRTTFEFKLALPAGRTGICEVVILD